MRMAKATLRFYAELNDFLPPGRRQRDLTQPFAAPTPVRHLIELAGVPHTEVEVILLDGESVDLETLVGDGQRLAVYPVFESFDARPLLRLRPAPLRTPRFLADAHLGALARRLRLLGFDTRWLNDLGDAGLVTLARREGRILLTRDRRLLMRRELTHGCFIRPVTPQKQLACLLERLQLCPEIAPFTRCTLCNGLLEERRPAQVQSLVPPRVRASQEAFWQCQDCKRLYWRGSHWQAMCRRIQALCPDWAPGSRDPGS
jgi:hypothetical protein